MEVRKRTIFLAIFCGDIWVCLKMLGIPPMKWPLKNGIMISKTIGCRGTLFSDKPI